MQHCITIQMTNIKEGKIQCKKFETKLVGTSRFIRMTSLPYLGKSELWKVLTELI